MAQKMDIGAFSVSLAVRNLQASLDFYEKLGFTPFMGDVTQNWLIMRNGQAVIGLFQGVFEKNLLTFNPGWDQDTQPLAGFTDVREIHKRLTAEGLTILDEVDEQASGPASFMLNDPDGNIILVDQHV